MRKRDKIIPQNAGGAGGGLQRRPSCAWWLTRPGRATMYEQAPFPETSLSAGTTTSEEPMLRKANRQRFARRATTATSKGGGVGAQPAGVLVVALNGAQIRASPTPADDASSHQLLLILCVAGLCSVGLAAAWLLLLRTGARALIWAGAGAGVVVALVNGVWLIAQGGQAGLVLGVGSLLVAAGCAAFVALNRHRVDFSATLLATVAHLVRVYPGMLWLALAASLVQLVWLVLWSCAVAYTATLRSQARNARNSAQFGGAIIRRNSPISRLPPPPAGGGAPPAALVLLDRPAHPRRRSRHRRRHRGLLVLPVAARPSQPDGARAQARAHHLARRARPRRARRRRAADAPHRRARPLVARRRPPPLVLPLPPRLHRRAGRYCEYAYTQIALYGELYARVAAGPPRPPLGRRRPRAEGLCGVGDGAGLARRRHVHVSLVGAWARATLGVDGAAWWARATAAASHRPHPLTSHASPTSHPQVLVAGFLVGYSALSVVGTVVEAGATALFVCYAEDPSPLPTLDSTLYATFIARPHVPPPETAGCCANMEAVASPSAV